MDATGQIGAAGGNRPADRQKEGGSHAEYAAASRPGALFVLGTTGILPIRSAQLIHRYIFCRHIQGRHPMSQQPDAAPHSDQPRANRAVLITAAVVVAVLGAIALDTTVVRIGSDADVRAAVFSPEAFGAETFPKVQANVTARAVDAVELATAIAADPKAAEAKYSVGGVYSVKLEGVAGEGKSGIYYVDVAGIPAPLRLRVQTGPAINGTELRDATGEISFSQFTNQIEYQDAGSALNKEMKKLVLDGVDNSALTGKTVSVVGAFKLVNPKSWMITPVSLELK